MTKPEAKHASFYPTCSAAVIHDSLKKVRNSVDKRLEYASYRRAIKNAGIAKAYLAGGLKLCVRLEWRHAPVGVAPNFREWYALVEISLGPQDHRSNAANNSKSAENGDMPTVRYGNEFRMLVDVCQSENGIEIIVPSRIRLLTKQELDEIGVEPIDFSALSFDASHSVGALEVP
ncbi:MAG: hypothetical protein AAF999_09145 [Pseudomonadota bacterium]